MDPKLAKSAHGAFKPRVKHKRLILRGLDAFASPQKNENQGEGGTLRGAASSSRKQERQFALDFSRKKHLLDNCRQQSLSTIKQQQDATMKRQKVLNKVAPPSRQHVSVFTPKAPASQGLVSPNFSSR